MANSTPQGYSGSAIVQPYAYSQVAVTWWELVSQANIAFADLELASYTLSTENFLQLTTEAGSGFPLQTDEVDISGTYFNTWLLALIKHVWPTYILAGPTDFSWGQVVLVNPNYQTSTMPDGSTTFYTQVFNPNAGDISLLNIFSLWLLPNDFVPEGVYPN